MDLISLIILKSVLHMKFNEPMMYELGSVASYPRLTCFPGAGFWPTAPSSSPVSQPLSPSGARALRLGQVKSGMSSAQAEPQGRAPSA